MNLSKLLIKNGAETTTNIHPYVSLRQCYHFSDDAISARCFLNAVSATEATTFSRLAEVDGQKKFLKGKNEKRVGLQSLFAFLTDGMNMNKVCFIVILFSITYSPYYE